MELIEDLKQILDKISEYNKQVEELNKLIKVQNLFGTFANPDRIKKSIESLIYFDYYGWFEDKPNIIYCDSIINNYNDEIANGTKNYNKSFKYKLVKKIIKNDHMDKYSKCLKNGAFDNISYLDLLIDIIREKIDNIYDYMKDLQIEERTNSNEKIRLYNDELQIVRNRHKSLANINVEEKNDNRINLLSVVDKSLDRINYNDNVIFILYSQTREDLNSFYNLFNELCLMRNELLNFKETQSNKKDMKQISKIISNLNKFVLTDDEKTLLATILPEEIYTTIESNINSYQPIDIKVKSIGKRGV